MISSSGRPGVIGAIAALVLAVVGAGALVPASAAAGGSLAGRHWRHSAQVDGRGAPDRIDIVGGKDLRLDSYGIGSGHVFVRVRLAGSGRVLSSRQLVGYFSVRTPWTPWLGATNLDHRGGKEILLGFSTGAHTQMFTALTYRGGRLRVLGAPGRSSWWAVNSSLGTGSQGWRCTARGVQSRAVAPVGGSLTTFRVVLNRYVRHGARWTRVSHRARIVHGTGGVSPAFTSAYPRFACAGLPGRVL